MMLLEKNKIIEFRNRLYQKHIPGILKSGTRDLVPVEACKKDENGNIIIFIDDIISFFFDASTSQTGLDLDCLFSNLFLLFDVLSKEAGNISFCSDVHIPEKEIEDADNKTTVELLTKNLILSYFKNFDSENDLLENDLNAIIKISRQGRDYQILVAKTLENLIQTLKPGKAWKEALLEIQTASVACTLMGARLPQIEKQVLLKIVSQSREEIKENTAFFAKVLDLRSRFIKENEPSKLYLKKMTKVDTALSETLSKIEDYLSCAYRFMHVTGASSQGFMGQTDEKLRNNMARFFFGYPEQGTDKTTAFFRLNYTAARYRMTMLLDYPGIAGFAGSLQAQEQYKEVFLSVFKLYFIELARLMDHFLSTPEDNRLKKIEFCLSETIGLAETLGLEKTAVSDEKKKLKENYLLLLRKLPLEQIAPVVDMKEDICRLIQDESKLLMEDIRKALVETCYSNLVALNPDSHSASDPVSADDRQRVCQKLIIGYALYYKPQRFFYQRFFETYISTIDGSLSKYFQELSRSHKSLALALLKIFSDPNFVEDLLLKEQIDCSRTLLKTFSEQ
ncbi:MAG: hypothetical protein KKE62_01480 [Proteobacteria bacterium]|nr:hypothetical protein [Pseudomonadota bacterium]MBU1387191.1 hypothetical protein [Pseudomonadota bacterium]MBU1541491.1 hypothetical protein [Pseudomonadota bacterium]MBU2429591.1 hypothetical protein [Pseudomonadota bacterium]MBU2480016.1 hypothetical protein [Pseudomonadota bacterium]